MRLLLKMVFGLAVQCLGDAQNLVVTNVKQLSTTDA
jgi:hypothetical protein